MKKPIDPRYLDDIRSYPALSREEEVQLAAAIKAGDNNARERFITSNLRLVITYAMDYSGLGVDDSDLIAEGNVGLMTAVDRFDPSFGTKFSVYAKHWILLRVLRALSWQSRTIRFPTYIVDQIQQMQKFDAFNFNAEDSEVAKKLKIRPKQVKNLRELRSQSFIPVDKVRDDVDDDKNPRHSVSDELREEGPDPLQQLLQKDGSKRLSSMISKLSKRHQTVLSMRFPEDGSNAANFTTIGKTLVPPVSRPLARQIYDAALAELKAALVER